MDIQYWADITQILSILFSVFVWFYPNKSSAKTLTKYINRIRPYIPYTFTATLFFFLGTQIIKTPNTPPNFQINSNCLAYQENGGSVVFDADKYTLMLPGKEYTLGKSSPNRNATDISWERNEFFSGTLQALPDIYDTNTLSDTNGPALVYLIDFRKTGKYYVYIRGFGVNNNGDSVHIGLSGQSTTSSFENGFAFQSSTLEPRWYWKTEKGRTTSIDIPNPGLYTFYIWARENGVNVQRIWLDVNQENVQNGDEEQGPPLSKCIEDRR